jgi:hypothetical protein
MHSVGYASEHNVGEVCGGKAPPNGRRSENFILPVVLNGLNFICNLRPDHIGDTHPVKFNTKRSRISVEMTKNMMRMSRTGKIKQS